MWKLVRANLKMFLRDRSTLFWSLAFPVIFVVVFGLFNFEQAVNVHIDVVAAHPSAVSVGLVSALRHTSGMTVKQASNLAAVRQELSDGKIDVVLVVPETGAMAPGTASAPLVTYYNQTSVQAGPYGLAVVRQVVAALNLRQAGVAVPPLTVKPRPVSARQISYYDWLLPGLVAMGVMNFSIMGIAAAIARFREQRILKRILATPLAPATFLAAQVLSRLVVALTQTALILVVGVLIFHAHIYGNVLWLFLLAALANIVFFNIGIAVAGRAPNTEAATSIAQAVALPMMFLSGVFFSTDSLLPQVVRTVVAYLPLTPLNEALRKVALDGQSITAVGAQVLLLALWVVVSFALASRTFTFSRT